jgi:protein-S-isoprenylcysteine O-methyltransferase Ste14
MAREPRHNQPDRPKGDTMLPQRRGRRFAVERIFVRVVATTGIIGIGVGLGALLADSKVQGWVIGLVVSLVSVVLAAVLWSSRQL